MTDKILILISIFFSPLKEGVRWNVCWKGCVISINSYIYPIVFLFYTTGVSIGFSQNINIDSLKNTEPDTIKINILTENKDSMQFSSDEKYAEIFNSAHASIE